MRRRLAATAGLALLSVAGLVGFLSAAQSRFLAPAESADPRFGMLAAASSNDASIGCTHGPGPCALFYPGTPIEVVQRVTQAMVEQAIAGQRYDVIATGEGLGSPWFSGGTSGPLRYSFLPDGVNVPSAFTGDPTGPNVLNQRMNALFGSPAVWKPIFAAAFARWAQITGIDYTEVGDDGAPLWGSPGAATRGDVRIAMRNIDGPLGVLAFNQYPQIGDMVLDSSENWALNANNDNHRWLRNTVMHEHGHGLGIQHICPINQSKLMEPFLTTLFDGPQHDDIRGAQYLYGDRFEPNGGTVNATLLGFLAHGANAAVNEVSVRNSSDVDVFSFTIPANTRVTIAVAPVGAVYNQEPQGSDGTCGPGTEFDSTNIQNLQFSLLNGVGSTIVSVNATGFRGVEQLINHLLPANGLYYVRVSSAASSTSNVQVYSLNLSVRSAAAPCPTDTDGDGVVNATDLANVLAVWGAAGGPMDFDHDGVVNATDLSYVLAQWGPCPS